MLYIGMVIKRFQLFFESPSNKPALQIFTQKKNIENHQETNHYNESGPY